MVLGRERNVFWTRAPLPPSVFSRAKAGALSNCTMTRTGVVGFVTLKSGETAPAKAQTLTARNERVSRSEEFISRSLLDLCIRRPTRKPLIVKEDRLACGGHSVLMGQSVSACVSDAFGKRGQVG